MAGKIEIIENTLLKLLIRRGNNSDRLNVILNEGELGYTTDTKKLYIGDGTTLGGVLVTGTKFLGETGDLTSLAPGDINDLGFSTVTNQLYYISTNDGSAAEDWVPISNLTTSGDGTITVNSDSGIVLGDAAGAGLTKDGSNKLEIDSSIATDTITQKTAAYLSLPQSTAFGNVNYRFPTVGSVNTYLRYNSGGTLTWEAIGGTSNTFVNAEIVSVGTIVPYADTSLPANNRWLLCDGSYISTVSYPELSAVIQSNFGPLSTKDSTQYFKLPDLRGKVALGFTNTVAYDLSGNGMTFSFASSGGEYAHLLTVNEMPSHRHDFTSTTGRVFYTINDAYNSAPTGAQTAAGEFRAQGPDNDNDATYYPYTGYTGASSAHVNIQPYLAIAYIIKALPDPVAECQITIGDNLTASEAIQGNVFNINPLSGNYTIGLESIIEPQNAGYLTVNSKGLITNFDTTSAGIVNAQGAYNTKVVHQFGFINFLHAPVSVASLSKFGSLPSSWTQVLTVFPKLCSSIFGDLATPNVNIPSTAKNIILQSRVQATNYQTQAVYSALNIGELLDIEEAGSGVTRGTNEYTVITGTFNNSMQAIVPLSSNENDGTLSLALRGRHALCIGFECDIIGWTM